MTGVQTCALPIYVHTPWEMDEPPAGYPAPIVDHAEERVESLRRYEAIKSAR